MTNTMFKRLQKTLSRHTRTSLLAFSLAAASLPAPSFAQQVTLTLNNADIRELISWAQDITKKTIIIHPNVKGKVTVMAGDPMSTDQAYQVFLSALQVHGFTAIETHSSLKILPDALAKQQSIPVVDHSAKNAEDMVVRIVKVRNVAATQLINILRPLVPQVGHLAAFPDSNTLIIADRAQNIEKILGIVSRIDQVGGVDIEVIDLDFASAKEVQEIVQKLVPGADGKGNKSSGLKLAADERSNSLLLSGDPAMRQQVRKLIARLDQPLAGDGNTQVFFLNYAVATDIAPILESISGSVQRNDKNQQAEDAEFSIQANDSLNAIVVTAPPALLDTMKGVIAKLDVRRAQVLVEALIVEVGEGVQSNIGVEWQAASESGNAGASGNFLNGVQGPNSSVTNPVSLAQGLSVGYFVGTDLRAVINVLASDADSNILSTPTIMALDNEEASILVGENVPFITGSQLQPSGGSDNSVNTFNTVERQDIGISLKVKPRINNDDSVSMEIEQTTENISTAAVSTADIITEKREIKTKVLIGNDEVLVLGGLIRDEISEVESKVPLLGDIPILGHAFKSKTTKTTKRNLMVFIHPKIIANRKQGTEVTRKRYEFIRQDQENFRKDINSIFLPNTDSPVLPERMGSSPLIDKYHRDRMGAGRSDAEQPQEQTEDTSDE